MEERQISINRPLVGILALGCFAAALVILVTRYQDESWRMWLAGFVRVGVVMTAFWLALPTRGRAAAWANTSPVTLVAILLCVFLVARFPMMIKVLLPVLLSVALVGFMLHPRNKRRPRRGG